MDDAIVPRIVDAIRGSRDGVLITSHERPDGDSVGSLLGLAIALDAAGRKVVIRCPDPVPAKYRFLPCADLVRTADQPINHPIDLIAVVDCAALDRIGAVQDLIAPGTPTINIDHHTSNTRFGDLVWVDTQAAATGQLIFQLLKAGAYPIEQQCATVLFAAISTDTGSFQYAQTTPATFEVAAELLRLGVDLASVSEALYMRFSRERTRLLSRLLDRANFECGGHFCYAWLDAELFRKTGARREETEGLIDHLRAVDGVVVAAILERLPDRKGIRLSLRSKHPDINVSDIAARFGGGGHIAAAGATVAHPSAEFEAELIAHVSQKIDQANLWLRD